MAQMQLGNLEAALAMSDDALKYSTNWWTNAAGMYQRVNILGLMGRDEEARGFYERLKRENQNSIRLLCETFGHAHICQSRVPL